MNPSNRRRFLYGVGASVTTIAATGVGSAAGQVTLTTVDVSQESSNDPPTIGETATVSPRVANESKSDTVVINRIRFDGNEVAYTAYSRIPAGESQWFETTVTPDSAGNQSVTVETFAWIGSGWRVVDSTSEQFSVNGGTNSSNPPKSETATGSTDGRIVGFYAGYNRPANDGWSVDEIPFDKITHLTVTFLNVKSDGTVTSEYEYWSETLSEIKSKSDGNTKLLLCIGGGYSENMADGIRTQAQRNRFAQSAVAMMREHEFDGLDLNWEYPGDWYEDGVHNGTLLLEQMRKELDAAGKEDSARYELAVTTGSGSLVHEHFELETIHSYLDYINVMCYDYVGPWNEVHDTGHNTPLDLTKRDMKGWAEETPFSADELNLGVPFYGRPFSGVPSTNNGLGQPYDSAGDLIGYRTLVSDYIGEPGWTKHWSEETSVPWLYNENGNRFITYNGVRSMRLKGDVADQYGGSMILGLSRDTDDHDLLDALIQGSQ